MDLSKNRDVEKIPPASYEERKPTQTSSFLQRLVGPKLFTIHATLIIALRTACYGYLSGILTTLERRFQLSSTEAGSLTIITDIAELSVIWIVSHFGHKSHRPRWISLGSVIMGSGMLISAIPHFISDPLDPNAVILGINNAGGFQFDTGDGYIANFGLCTSADEIALDVHDTDRTDDTLTEVPTNPFNQSVKLTISHLQSGPPSNQSAFQCKRSSSHLGPVAWIVIGQIIMGIGSSPMFPLILSYIDDSVDRVKYTSYTACIFMAFGIGPPLGLLMSAWATSLYVDFNRIASEDIPDLPLEDPRWIGAWWLGMVLCFIGLVIVGIPMYFYPKSMDNRRQTADEDKNAGNGEDNADDDSLQRSRGNSIFEHTSQVRGLIRSLKRLIINLPLTLLYLGGCAELAAVGIIGLFGIKYIQTQFSLSASGAASLFGMMVPLISIISQSFQLLGRAILVTGCILSNFASAYICRRFHFNVKQCGWFTVGLVSLSLPIIPILMVVGCSNVDVAGVNVEYLTHFTENTDRIPSLNGQSRSQYTDQLDSVCNIQCHCSNEIFQPVCGENAVTYISPCHAGCTTTLQSTGNETVYSNCGCIGTSEASNNTATSNQCAAQCPVFNVVVFSVMSFFILFAMSSIQNPITYIIMRIVKERDRSMAVGWKLLVTKSLGYFPAPVYFGAIINATCTLWQYSCGERGSCWLYDIVSYRHAFFGTLLGLRCSAIVCYLAMIRFLEDDYPNDNKKEKEPSTEKNRDKLNETDINETPM